jgi:hypothetical protein
VGRTGSGIPFVNIQDEFVSWLTFANSGMLSKGNLLCFDYAIRNLPAEGAMVEIGVCAGLSTNLLAYYRARHGVSGPFFNCDAWRFEGVVGQTLGKSGVRHDDYRAFDHCGAHRGQLLVTVIGHGKRGTAVFHLRLARPSGIRRARDPPARPHPRSSGEA